MQDRRSSSRPQGSDQSNDSARTVAGAGSTIRYCVTDQHASLTCSDVARLVSLMWSFQMDVRRSEPTSEPVLTDVPAAQIRLWKSGVVSISPMADHCDFHSPSFVVYEVENAVLTAACRPSRGEWRFKRLAYTVRIPEEGSCDKGVSSCGDLLGQKFREGSRGWARNDETVWRVGEGRQGSRPAKRIFSASSAESRVSSASRAFTPVRWSWSRSRSESTAIVSRSAS
jgi:hypothetical protein